MKMEDKRRVSEFWGEENIRRQLTNACLYIIINIVIQ